MSDYDCYMPGVVGQQIEDEIECAKDGDAEAARRLLQRFCGAIVANTDKNGNPYRTPSGIGTRIDERILRYLAECFQKILDDGPGARTDANKALNLTAPNKKGRHKSRSRRQKVLDWGYEVYERVEKFKADKKRAPVEDAIASVAKENHVSVDTMKDAYDEFRRLLKRAATNGDI